MEIGAVYLQPVMMEPMLPGMHEPADVHLEADIHAVKDNKNGFGPGDWVPYLGITYRISKEGSPWVGSGAFMPMVASDGPHYGANVKLDGPGKYKLLYHIQPPPYQGSTAMPTRRPASRNGGRRLMSNGNSALPEPARRAATEHAAVDDAFTRENRARADRRAGAGRWRPSRVRGRTGRRSSRTGELPATSIEPVQAEPAEAAPRAKRRSRSCSAISAGCGRPSPSTGSGLSSAISARRSASCMAV